MKYDLPNNPLINASRHLEYKMVYDDDIEIKGTVNYTDTNGKIINAISGKEFFFTTAGMMVDGTTGQQVQGTREYDPVLEKFVITYPEGSVSQSAFFHNLSKTLFPQDKVSDIVKYLVEQRLALIESEGKMPL